MAQARQGKAAWDLRGGVPLGSAAQSLGFERLFTADVRVVILHSIFLSLSPDRWQAMGLIFCPGARSWVGRRSRSRVLSV